MLKFKFSYKGAEFEGAKFMILGPSNSAPLYENSNLSINLFWKNYFLNIWFFQKLNLKHFQRKKRSLVF